MTGHPGERLSAYLDDALAPGERAEVDRHLATCEACATELAEMAAVDGLGASLRDADVPAPAGYFEALPGRVRERVRGRRPRAGLPAWALAAAAVLAVAVTAPLVLRETREARVAAPVAAPQPAPPAGRVAEAPAPAIPEAQRAPEPEAADETPRALPRQPPPVQRPPARATAPAPARQETRLADATAPERAEKAEGFASREDRPAAPAGAGTLAPAQEQEADTTSAAAAAPRPAAKATRDRRAASLGQAGAPAPAAPAAAATTVDGARQQRDTWLARAAAATDAVAADDARVRAIEAALLAWRLGSEAADAETARRLAAEYLRRDDVRQAARVRQALRDAGLPER